MVNTTLLSCRGGEAISISAPEVMDKLPVIGFLFLYLFPKRTSRPVALRLARAQSQLNIKWTQSNPEV